MTELTIFEGKVNVPAHLASRIGQPSRIADEIVTGLSGNPINRISIRAARFRAIVNGEEKTLKDFDLDVVVVGARGGLAKQYYASDYNEDTKLDAPDCFSYDGKRPHHSIDAPVCESCTSCPMNRFGSKISKQGKEIKACTDTKRLAVVLANYPKEGVFLLSVSPTALKALNQYTAELRKRGIPPECIRTTLSFDEAASYPKLMFKFGGFLTEEEQMKVDVFLGSDEVNRIIGLDDVVEAETNTVKEQPVQVVKPKKSATKTKAAPVVEESTVVEEATVVEVKEVTQSAEPVEKKESSSDASPWDANDNEAFETVKASAPVTAKQPVVLEGETADALSNKLDALFGK